LTGEVMLTFRSTRVSSASDNSGGSHANHSRVTALDVD
jgi:hypothetical protein